MKFTPLLLLLFPLMSFGKPTVPAQDLANAERRLESVQRTKEATEGIAAEVARLGSVWLLDEAGRAKSLPLEERTARFAELLRQARLRGLKETEQRLEVLAKPVFESWLGRSESLFTHVQALRAVAYRRALMDQLPQASGLAGLGQPIETRAASWLAGERSGAQGSGDAYAVDAALALLKVEHLKLPEPLERLIHAAGEVQVTSGCAKATPSMGSATGVTAIQSARIDACSESHSDADLQRSVPWTDTVIENVEKEQEYDSLEYKTFTVWEMGDDTLKTTTKVYNSGGNFMYDDEKIKVYRNLKQVTKTDWVKVKYTRKIMVPTKRAVDRIEQFTVRVRTHVATVPVGITIEGDGQRVDRQEMLRGTAKEEEYSSAHGGSSRFTGEAQGLAMSALKSEVAAYYQRVHGEWVTRRGAALLAIAKNLDQKVTASVMLGEVPPAVAQALMESLGMTAEESSHLVKGDGRLTPGAAPVGPKLELPPPEVGLKNDLETRELVVATTDMQGGYFGGLFLGAVTGEQGDGELSPGFGGFFIVGYRPGFSVRSHLLTRMVGQVQVGHTDVVLMDGSARAELGVQFGPLSLAGLGVVQEVGGFGDGDSLVAAAGYGGRAQLSVEVFRAHFEAGPAPVAFGTEVIVARMHRASSATPLGANLQTAAFVDLGHIVKISLVLRVTTSDDLPELMSSKTQRLFCGIGIQSDF